MQGHFIQFIAYTMAMVGFISVCLLTYKKLCIQTQSNKNSECLCIENALKINPKKQIYVVRAGNERFLVASDSETTTMLAKLEDSTKESKNAENMISFNKFQQKREITDSDNTTKVPAFKRIAEKMKV